MLGGEVGQGRHPGREVADEAGDGPDPADRPRVLALEGQRGRPGGRPPGQLDALFDSVADNLIRNALAKRAADAALRVRVT